MAEERVPLEIRRAEPEDAAELLSIYAPYVDCLLYTSDAADE